VRRRLLTVLTLIAAALAIIATISAPAASAASGDNYVALGDSYSSGVGAGSYTAESGSCDRSLSAYPALWAGANSVASFTFAACSGATTADVASSQLGALSPSTSLVSITIGGNDENFAGIMEDCNLYSDDTCVSEIQAAEDDAQANLPGKLASLYGQISSRAPSARVVVLDYPRFYDLANDCIGLSQTKRTKIDEGIDVLDGILQNSASAAGFGFADVRGAFTGHEICDSNRWLHSVNFSDFSESYHPTADGHAQAYLPVFTSAAG
jgi:lysophospholipase L1-like esterase